MTMSEANDRRPISLRQLMDENVKPIDFVVDGLLSTGLYVLAGAPKSGKSWLALWLCLCVARGAPLWGIPTTQGGALYLCLEDNRQRLQNRLLDILGDDVPSLPVHFLLDTEPGDELLSTLTDFIRQHPDTRLIVIDTLQKVRNDGPDYSYAADYQLIGALKRFADAHNICVLAVHHTRKQKDADPLNTISGTTGISGAADGLLLLQLGERAGNKASLLCTGRDIESRELKLEFDRESLIWNKLSDSLDKPLEPCVEAVINFVHQHERWQGTVSELCLVCGINDVKPNVLSRRLTNAAAALRRSGIAYAATRTGEQRMISLIVVDDANDGISAPAKTSSQPSQMGQRRITSL